MLIPQILSRGLPAAVLLLYCERVNLLTMVGVVLSLPPRRGSKVAGAIPDEAGIVDPSTLGSADGPVVPDGDDPATPTIPCDAAGPADVPVIQDEVDPAIPNAAAPMCHGDPDDVAPKIPCEDALLIPAPVMLPVPVIPGDADPCIG